jgi:hypothetical protein
MGMIGVRHTPLDICRRVDAGCGHDRDDEDEGYGNDDDEKQSGMVTKHEDGAHVSCDMGENGRGDVGL